MHLCQILQHPLHPIPGTLRVSQEYTLIRTLLHHRTPHRHTITHLGVIYNLKPVTQHVFQSWEETREPRGNQQEMQEERADRLKITELKQIP